MHRQKESRGRRRFLAVAGVVFAPWWPAAAAAASARTLRVVGPWELNGLEPGLAGYLFTRMQVTETLVDADDDGRLLPGLAARWTVSGDGLRWRFDLRPNARFHDGTAVTPEHVAWLLRRAMGRPGVLALAPVEDARADKGSVEVRLRSAFAPLPALLAHTSTQILAASAFDASDRVVRIIGTGPYRMVRLEPPQRLEIEALPEWEGGRPAVRRASYLSAGRAETRALMAESGQADLAFALDPPSIRRLKRRREARVVAVTIPRTTLLKVNCAHPWLSDARARLALSLSLDRVGMAGALMRDPELAATQLFPPTLVQWHRSSIEPLHGDPARARELLAQLGWTRGEDGILTRAGQRFVVSLRTFPDRPELPLLATAIQEQFRQVGIALKVRIGNSGDIPLAHRDGTLELGLAPRSFGQTPDPLATVLQDYGGGGGDWGAMNWRDARLDAALDALRSTTDASRTATLRAAVASILQEQLPVIPVLWYRQNAAVSERVEGVSIDPLERSYRLTRIAWRAGVSARSDHA